MTPMNNADYLIHLRFELAVFQNTLGIIKH